MFNEQLFRNNIALLEKLILYRLEEIEKEVIALRLRFDILPVETKVPYQTPEQFDYLYDDATRKMREFRKLHNGYPKDFIDSINAIRKTTGLGREWNSSLFRLTITGILLPPPFSVFVIEDEERKTITFEINKNTTRDDLLHAWDSYEDTRIELFGRSKAHHVSPKEIARLNLVKQLEAEKRERSMNDKQTVSDLMPSTDAEGNELPFEKMIEIDEKNQNWLKKNRERFKKEVTD